MTIFEAVILSSLALASTLMVFVARGTLAARDGLQMFMIMGSSLAGMLAFYESPLHGLRYWGAAAGIPACGMVWEWLFGPIRPLQPQHPHVQ